MEKRCEQCNKVFKKKPNESKKVWANRKFCSHKCSYKYQMINYGSPVDFEKLHKANIGNKYTLGKKITKEHKEKIRVALTGKKRNNPSGKYAANWRGGKTPEYQRIRTSIEYRLWREAVFARDNWTCQECGDKTGGNLQAHHIKRFSQFPELRFAIDNGLTLCKECHKKTDNWGTKGLKK